MYGAVDDKGECVASVWLACLDDRTIAQFRARFARLTEVGYLRSPDEMRVLQCPGSPPVSEIKTRTGFRLYAIRHEEDWVAAHGAKKPSDRRVCAQAARAREIFEGAQRK